MELENIATQIPESEPKLRLYTNYAVLNAAAVNLLGIEEGDYVQFRTPPHMGGNGRPLLYVHKTRIVQGSFRARRRGFTAILSSRKLSKLLQGFLDGLGCYRVCPDDVVFDDEGGKYYNVFFRNYGY